MIFLWLRLAEEAFIGPTIKLEIEDEHAASKADHQIKRRCAGRVRLQEGRDRHDAGTAPGLSADHFGYAPDEVTWAHVGTLEHYADLLKRITDMAFNEGEHAA